MDVIRLGTFTPSVLLEVAQASGELRAADVEVVQTAVPSSPAQFASVRDGEFDAVFTSPDNVLAYRFLPGNPLGELLDVEIVAALDRGLGLSVAAAPGIHDAAELRGGRLGVDVPGSGFAFVAYALLAELGLERGDYEVVTLGSTPKRLEALQSGGCDVTVLNAGNELLAREAGCALLADVGLLGPYLGTVVARLVSAAGGEAVDRLVAALVRTSDRIRAGAADAETIAAAQRVLGLSADAAAAHLAVLRDPTHGLVAGGVVPAEALRTLVALRARALPAPELDGLDARFAEVVRAGALA